MQRSFKNKHAEQKIEPARWIKKNIKDIFGNNCKDFGNIHFRDYNTAVPVSLSHAVLDRNSKKLMVIIVHEGGQFRIDFTSV